MMLERRTVSRKTPGDGRLEITKRAAERLLGRGADLRLEVGGRYDSAAVGTMACTCRGGDEPHEHYFLESPALRQLTPGAEVGLELDADGLVRVTTQGWEG